MTSTYQNIMVTLICIHKYLFEDIYPFAGEFRIVNIGKGNRAGFTDYNRIEENLKDILSNIDDKLINNSNSKFFSKYVLFTLRNTSI